MEKTSATYCFTQTYSTISETRMHSPDSNKPVFGSESIDLIQEQCPMKQSPHWKHCIVRQVATDSKPQNSYTTDISDHTKRVRLIKMSGAYAHPIDCYKKFLLHNAVESNDIISIKTLIAAGLCVNITREDGSTPLHIAARQGYIDAIKFLLIAGAKIDSLDLFCKTALHWAAYKGCYQTVELLISYGANLTIQDDTGCTPLEIATLLSHVRIVKLFREKLTQ